MGCTQLEQQSARSGKLDSRERTSKGSRSETRFTILGQGILTAVGVLVGGIFLQSVAAHEIMNLAQALGLSPKAACLSADESSSTTNRTGLTGEDAKTKEIEGISTLHRGWHPASYIGKVWVKVIPSPENMGKQHCVKITWGAYRFGKMLSVGESLNLVHSKRNPDSIPLTVEVEPAAKVEFGQQEPLGINQYSITDSEWVTK